VGTSPADPEHQLQDDQASRVRGASDPAAQSAVRFGQSVAGTRFSSCATLPLLVFLCAVCVAGVLRFASEPWSRFGGDLTRPCSELGRLDALRVTTAQSTNAMALRRWITETYGLADGGVTVRSYDLTDLRLHIAESYGLAERAPTVEVGDILELRLQIAEEYGLVKRQAIVEPHDEGLDLSWSKDGINYSASGNNSSGRFEVVEAYAAFADRQPSIGHLLQCLGWRDPAFYKASWEPHASPEGKKYFFSAYFPDRGASLISGHHYFGFSVPSDPPPLNRDLSVAGISFVHPGSIEDVLGADHRAYGTPLPPMPNPWPGGWEKLEYVTLP
jgi:hypothetical protein